MICVLLPLIVTDSVFLVSVVRNVRQEESDEMEDVLNRVVYELNTTINNVTAISDYLYMNERLNEFVEQEYASPAEYYKYFNRFMEDSVIRYYYTTESVYNVQICTDNDSMVDGMYFKHKDAVRKESWYRRYQQNQERMFIQAYYVEDSEYEKSMNHARHVSLIRKMNCFGGDSVMKIDFDYDALAGNIVEYEAQDTDIYVCDGEKIIFDSHSSGNGKEDFLPLSSYRKKEVEVSGTLDVPGETWKI